MNLIGKKFENVRLGMEIYVYDVEGKDWFIGKDIAKMLGYKDPSSAVKDNIKPNYKIKKYVKTVENIGNGENTHSKINNNLMFISEFGLYQLVVGSKLPKAEEFQKWVYEDVLPALRKDGAYIDTKHISEDQIIALQNEVTVLQGVILKGLNGTQKAMSTVSATIFNGNKSTLKRKLVEEGFISEDEKTVHISHVKRVDGTKIPILLKKEFQNQRENKIKTTHTIKVTGLGEVYFMYHFGLVKNNPQFER